MNVEFAEFAASRVDRLLALAYLLTGNHHSAEDLVQEVLIKAHRRWSRVLAADDADAYVRRMLVNEHISWRRRRSSTELPFEQTTFGQGAPWPSGPRRLQGDARSCSGCWRRPPRGGGGPPWCQWSLSRA